MTHSTTSARKLKPAARRIPVWLRAVGIVLVIYLVLPTLIVIPMSFTGGTTFQFPPQGWSLRWYENFFTDPRWLDALVHSLEVAVTVTIVATILGTGAALALQRMHSRWAQVLRALLMLPLVAPGIVLAVVIYIAYLKWHLVGTFSGYVFAHTAIGLPFVLVAVNASLESFDRSLLRAAASLGSNSFSAFRRVQLPMILPGILSGAVLAFVTSLDEVVVALFIRSPIFETLPVRMFNSVTIDIDPTVGAASSILAVLATAIVLSTQLRKLFRRRHAPATADKGTSPILEKDTA